MTQPAENPSVAPQAPSAPGSAARAATQELVERIRKIVVANTRRWRGLLFLEALGLAVALPLTYLWMAFLLDNLLHLSRVGRVVASAGFFVGAAVLVWSLAARWRRMTLTEDQVALAIEKRTPGGVQNRLINALQLSRDPRVDDTDYRQAVVQENYQRLQQIHLEQAAEMRPAAIRVGLAGFVVLVGIGFWGFYNAYFTNAAKRILMPLADVAPLYRTTLEVDPGNVEASGDVAIHVKILGKHPGQLTFLRSAAGARTSETVVVPSNSNEASFVFRGVTQTTDYAVRGGDFLSEYYRIEVPAVANLNQVNYTYHLPEYTRQADRPGQSATGDLEALVGTKAKLVFVFDQSTDDATMIVQRTANKAGRVAGNAEAAALAASTTAPAGSSGATAPIPTPAALPPQRIALTKVSDRQFSCEIVFEGVMGYQLETHQGKHPPHLSQPYALRVRTDQDPTLELSGLERQAEASLDSVMPLRLAATDDYGLAKVGLFYRHASDAALDAGPARAAAPGSPATAPAAPGADAKADPKNESASSASKEDGGWKPVEVWTAESTVDLRKLFDLSIVNLAATEGDKLEIALRAADTDPLKKGRWITGTPYTLAIGGEGVLLQLQYEQIIRSERDLKSLMDAQKQAMEPATVWMRNLDPSSGMNVDDAAGRGNLAAAMKDQLATQEKLTTTAQRVAREMALQAGNLRIGVGMLADTEMMRACRIINTVTSRDTRQGKSTALGEARLTQDRVVRSLGEMFEQYVSFRQEWEQNNMIPVAKLLADRQAALRDEATKVAQVAGTTGAAQIQGSASRRQRKVIELVEMSIVSLKGLGERTMGPEPILGKAYAAASVALSAPPLTAAMKEAAEAVQNGKWADAVPREVAAAQMLAAIHTSLRQAQNEAAQAALAALQEKAKSDLEAQKELDKLKTGSTENLLELPAKLKIEDIMHMREVAGAKKGDGNGSNDAQASDRMFDDSVLGKMQQADSGARQGFSGMTLAKKPDAAMHVPGFSDTKSNKVTPWVQEQFEDLVGKLLDEAENLEEKYDTYNLNAGWNISEAGDVSKQSGPINSTAAAAATGNQKPPPNDIGGISRSGRQGARSHGMVVGDESQNLKGRDKALQGPEFAPSQEGLMKQKKSDDPAGEPSVGMGGKKVDDPDATFSKQDAGKFTNDVVDKMGKPKDRFSIVERKDDPLDPAVAEKLRDLTSTQEQVVDRVKAIRKELKNLFLPTDHLDEAEAALQANLEALKERPSAELFRQQAQTLEKLRNTVRVFDRGHGDFQPGDLRPQNVKGRILDEPAKQTIPGYEEAVKQYYEMLSSQ
ncbi:MAG: hypothetical protein NTW19_07225 [Planctomycetota bacterium]|nr:hypothetical protein [Planctomycetota bacterium]